MRDASERHPARRGAVAGVLALGCLFAACGPDDPVTPPPASGAHFEDLTKAAGITFRTDFLPNEQGENFKINLDRAEITWPGGKKQVLPDVTLGTVHRIEEPR